MPLSLRPWDIGLENGKQEEWKFWVVKFLARARHKGFREILLGTIAIPKDSEKFDLTKADEKEKSEIRNKNKLAFKELILSIDTSTGKMVKLPSSQFAAAMTMTIRTAMLQMHGKGFKTSLPQTLHP